MKTSLISISQLFLSSLVLFVLTYTPIAGQINNQTNYQVLKKAKYVTWVKPINDSPIMKGYLYDVGDDHILMLSSTKTETIKFNFKDTKRIEFRRHGSIIFGAAIGGLTGFLAMTSINRSLGWIIHPKRDPLIAASAGALIGCAIGSIKIYKPIKGDSQYQKEKLMKYKMLD